MTVSHLFYDFGLIDASINYEAYQKNNDTVIPYNINDRGFNELLQCVALGTKANFSYNPTTEEIKKFLAKTSGQHESVFKDH